MKQLYVLFALFAAVCVQSQIVNIPDQNFKNKLLYANYVAQNASGVNIVVDSNHDGEIQVSEALVVRKLSITNSAVSSFEGIQSFTNLQEFTCDNNWIVTLDVSMLPALKKLSCQSCGLTALTINGLSVLEELYANSNSLSSLALTNLPALKTLDVNFNGLSTVNLSNLLAIQTVKLAYNNFTGIDISNLPNLSEVSLSGNELVTINAANLPSLKSFDLSQNQFTGFDISIFPALESFNGTGNTALTSLTIGNLANLKSLSINGGALTSLDLSGATNLNDLYCDGNLMTSLDVSALTQLAVLSCEGGQLASINFGTIENLTYLNCDFNQLTSLDLSHLNGMINLQCRDNGLTTIDVSGMPDLYFFACSGNQLQSLDLSHNGHINFLECQANQLQYLLAKNGNDESGFNFSGNPTLQYICVDESQIQGVTQLMYNFSFQDNFSYVDNCALNSYCSFVPGGDYYEIQGTATVDADNDGCGASDPVFPTMNLQVTDGLNSSNFIGNASGHYIIPVQAGTHTVSPQLENPTYFTVSPATIAVEFPAQASPLNQDFCIAFNGVHQDLEVVVMPTDVARPGFDSHYRIIYKNKGTTTETGTVTFLFEDDKMDVVSANPAATQSGSVLSWDYAGLQPFEMRTIEITLNANSPAETPAVNIGDQLNFQATINEVLSDETPTDNVSGFKQVVRGALDPNDKTCLEGPTVSPDIAGNYAHYVIRFENTGNFPAENVVVKDYIDTTKFDVSSIVPLAGSHPFVTRITGANLLEFIFEGIQLPFDDANNDGYVAFKIKTKPTLTLGDSFSNTASIYFDYNLPVITNTATTTIQLLGVPDVDFGDVFVLYPNPANSVLNIMPRGSARIESVSVYDALGRLALATTGFSGGLDVSSLASGTYFLKVHSDAGSAVARFTKE